MIEDDIERLKRNIIELDFNRVKTFYAFKYLKKKLKTARVCGTIVTQIV